MHIFYATNEVLTTNIQLLFRIIVCLADCQIACAASHKQLIFTTTVGSDRPEPLGKRFGHKNMQAGYEAQILYCNVPWKHADSRAKILLCIYEGPVFSTSSVLAIVSLLQLKTILLPLKYFSVFYLTKAFPALFAVPLNLWQVLFWAFKQFGHLPIQH